MIRVIIPKGMSYRRVEKAGVPYDYFIRRDKFGVISDRICLQDIAKEACQHRDRRRDYMPVSILGLDFKVYFKVRTKDNEDIGKPVVYYWQTDSGTKPASRVKIGIFGENRGKDATAQSFYGTFWHQYAMLSPKRQREVEARQLEVRHNRRKDGDCPKPN